MFMNSLKVAVIAALPMLAAGSAMAGSLTVMQEYPVKQSQQVTDHALTDQLQKQGFQDVSLVRDGTQLKVSGMRQGEELTLIYDGAQGRLVQVSGHPGLMQQMLDDSHAGRGSPGQEN